jgi:hypothetical protein
VITVSRSSSGICAISGCPQRVVVVPNGVHARFRPRSRPWPAVFRFRPAGRLHPLPGGLNPHKNVICRSGPAATSPASGLDAAAAVIVDQAATPKPYIVTSAHGLQGSGRQPRPGQQVRFLGVPPDGGDSQRGILASSLYEGLVCRRPKPGRGTPVAGRTSSLPWWATPPCSSTRRCRARRRRSHGCSTTGLWPAAGWPEQAARSPPVATAPDLAVLEAAPARPSSRLSRPSLP